MADSKEGLAVVERLREKAFLDVADMLGLNLASSGQISASPSHGARIELILYQWASR